MTLCARAFFCIFDAYLPEDKINAVYGRKLDEVSHKLLFKKFGTAKSEMSGLFSMEDTR